MKIAIKQARIIDPSQSIDKVADIAIEEGHIVKIGSLPAGFSADKTIEGQEKWVIPGIVDLCCRPQMLHPQGTTLIEEAQSALKRGITSLCIPPDSEPIIDTPAHVARLIQQGERTLPALYPMGALTDQLKGQTVSDLTSLAQAGCFAFTNAQKPIKDLNVLRHCLDYASSFNLRVFIQPQDPWLSKGTAHEGIVATSLGLPGIPPIAETIALSQALLLIEHCGVKAHFTCLSTAKAVQQIREAKAKGLPVTADTAMHSLHLTEKDIGVFNANCHLYPPLRSEEDRKGLLAGIRDGTLDAICSDHRPLDSIAKLAPFGDTVPGLSAIDTLLSLGLRLVNQRQLELPQLIKVLTFNPAQIAGSTKGTLKEGVPADLCLIDPHSHWQVNETTLYSKGKNTPFNNWELTGIVTHTLLAGKVVHER